MGLNFSDKMYDVIIIGTGPGGLKCAEQLKDSGLSVLLTEKNEAIGPKICAGGLTNLVKASDLPEGKARTFSKQKIFFVNKEYEISLVNPLKTIERADLGQYQLSKIRDYSNIKILTKTSVMSIKKNEIITNRGSYYFKYLVGADGSSSATRRHLSLRAETCIGIYCNVPDVTDDFVWYLNPKLIKSGYIWGFPHKNYTNIGIYFNPYYLDPKRAKGILGKHLADKGYSFYSDDFRGAPINYSYKGCVFDNIFLVGDAAGLASKTTGEGISFALISGQEIGKRILDRDYKMVELDRIIKIKNRQEKMLKIYETFPHMQKYFFKIFVNLMKKGWFQPYFGN